MGDGHVLLYCTLQYSSVARRKGAPIDTLRCPALDRGDRTVLLLYLKVCHQESCHCRIEPRGQWSARPCECPKPRTRPRPRGPGAGPPLLSAPARTRSCRCPRHSCGRIPRARLRSATRSLSLARSRTACLPSAREGKERRKGVIVTPRMTGVCRFRSGKKSTACSLLWRYYRHNDKHAVLLYW